MQAIICRKYEGLKGLELINLPSPPLAGHKVRISIRACGVNFADSLAIAGQYQDNPPLPFTPGIEAAGIVTETGSSVTSVSVGDRVICLNRNGGYATETIADEAAVIAIPDQMDFPSAAAFSLTYGTAHIALDYRAKLAPGETLVVHGAGGGVGMAATEIGKAMGARVLAIAGTDEKLEILRDRGADHFINHTKGSIKQQIMALTDGRGADVAFDPVGGRAFRESLSSMNFEGRILVIGFASGDIPQIPANHLLVKNIDVLGVFWGAYKHKRPDQLKQSLQTLLDWYQQGRLAAPYISHTFPLAETARAIETLCTRQSTGKVVVIMDK